VLPYIYLGAGVLFAATGSAFLVCQYDPFVPVFRMDGRSLMVLAGVALLLLGMFVGRPYCRFLCPYGALLKLASVVAKFRVRVTPDYCTQCRLCEVSCPFGAMRQPEAAKAELSVLRQDRRRLVWAVLALPLLVLAGVWAGAHFSNAAARVHPTVKLAEEYLRTRGTPPPTGALTPDQRALERVRNAPKEILEQAMRIREQFRIGTQVFGGWVGLVIGVKLVSLCLRRRRTDYEPDRGDCFACARCFEYCPNELVRRGIIPVLAGAEPKLVAVPAMPARGITPAAAPKEVAP
jgi:polyferredoxin